MESSYKGYTADQIRHMTMREYSEAFNTKTIVTRSDRPDKPMVYNLPVQDDSYEFYRIQYIKTGNYEFLEKMVERVEPYEEQSSEKAY